MVPSVLARVPSSSNPSKSYEIRKGADGVCFCTCPSWRFQKNSPSNRTCKHIEGWKATTKVPGSNASLLDVLGPGPEAIRAPRKPRARKAPAPVVESMVRHDTIPCPPPAVSDDGEPMWDCDAQVAALKSA